MDYDISCGYGGCGQYKRFDRNYSEDFGGRYNVGSLYSLDMKFEHGYKVDKGKEYQGH